MNTVTLHAHRVGYMLYLMGFHNPQILQSPAHQQEIAVVLLRHMQHSNLSQFEYQALVYFAQLKNEEIGQKDFEAMAAHITSMYGVVTNDATMRQHFNDAIKKLAHARTLIESLQRLSLVIPTDRDGTYKPVVTNFEITVPEYVEHSIVDADGRIELLHKLLEKPVERLRYRLGDQEVVRRVDRELVAACTALDDGCHNVVKKLFGLGFARLDSTALMEERACHHEVIRRDLNTALRTLDRQGVARRLTEILGVEEVAVTV